MFNVSQQRSYLYLQCSLLESFQLEINFIGYRAVQFFYSCVILLICSLQSNLLTVIYNIYLFFNVCKSCSEVLYSPAISDLQFLFFSFSLSSLVRCVSLLLVLPRTIFQFLPVFSFFAFCQALGMLKFLSQGSNPCHSNSLSCCSGNARSLAHCAVRELLGEGICFQAHICGCWEALVPWHMGLLTGWPHDLAVGFPQDK